MKSGLFGARTERRKRGGFDGDLDITPMIDVTFLLLIFFMVTSTMQATPDIDLPVARQGAGIDKHSQVTISLIEQDGVPILIAGDPPGPARTLPEILEMTRSEIQRGKTGVLLKASGQIPTGYIKEVTQQLQSVGDLRFYYAVGERD